MSCDRASRNLPSRSVLVSRVTYGRPQDAMQILVVDGLVTADGPNGGVLRLRCRHGAPAPKMAHGVHHIPRYFDVPAYVESNVKRVATA